MGITAPPGEQRERLVAANVKAQFALLVQSEPIRQIWQSGQELELFG